MLGNSLLEIFYYATWFVFLWLMLYYVTLYCKIKIWESIDLTNLSYKMKCEIVKKKKSSKCVFKFLRKSTKLRLHKVHCLGLLPII